MSEIEAKPDIRGRSSVPDKAGSVVGALPDGVYVVECGGAKLRCRRAFSCLVEPRIGDRVVVCGADSRCVYVIAILARPNADGVQLRVEGDLVLEATRRVCVTSGDALRLASREQLSIETQRLTMSARQAALTSEKTTLTSAAFDGRLGKIRLIGRLLETVMEHIAQSCRSSFRTVETVEHLRASHIDHAAAESMRMHAKHTLLTAETLTKIDAAQIHLG